MDDRMAIQILFRSGFIDRFSSFNFTLCVATVARICSYIIANSSYAHPGTFDRWMQSTHEISMNQKTMTISGRCHTTTSVRKGGWSVSSSRISCVAIGRWSHHCKRTHTVRTIDNFLTFFKPIKFRNKKISLQRCRCRNLSEYMKIAERVKEFFHNEGIHSTTIQPEFVEIEGIHSGSSKWPIDFRFYHSVDNFQFHSKLTVLWVMWMEVVLKTVVHWIVQQLNRAVLNKHVAKIAIRWVFRCCFFCRFSIVWF